MKHGVINTVQEKTDIKKSLTETLNKIKCGGLEKYLNWNSGCLTKTKPSVWSPTSQKTVYSAIPVFNHSSREKSEVQGHPLLKVDFRVSLIYMRCCLIKLQNNMARGWLSKVFLVQAWGHEYTFWAPMFKKQNHKNQAQQHIPVIPTLGKIPGACCQLVFSMFSDRTCL